MLIAHAVLASKTTRPVLIIVRYMQCAATFFDSVLMCVGHFIKHQDKEAANRVETFLRLILMSVIFLVS